MAKGQTMKTMVAVDKTRERTLPLNIPRSMRGHRVKSFTSLPAGKCVPIAAIPLLREDAVRRGRMSFSFEMHETAEIIMNGVLVRVQAHLVPWLAFERFDGSMDLFNKSYAGEPLKVGDDLVPFFEVSLGEGQGDILKYLGLHVRSGVKYNTMYEEAYNLIYNHRATSLSKKLKHRLRRDGSLANAFWIHQNYNRIVPDYEQALLDGDIPLALDDGKLPVVSTHIANYGRNRYPQAVATGISRKESDGETRWNFGEEIYAELEGIGVSLSLANIQLARKTAAFAKLREQYSGHDDDYIINMLMDGIRIPDEYLKHPIKVGQQTSVFGMAKRYATDGTNLNESVVNGMTAITMDVNVPRLNTGGVLMFTAEIMPEQLFEREKDPFLSITDVDELPQFMRDHLDPEPVDIVSNDYIDVDHSKPDDTFGYEPLNAKFNINASRVGGRYYRPKVNSTTDQDRQRIWAVEAQNPVLGEDFYLCKDIHLKPFVDRVNDPFEVVALGDFSIEGNTVFGPSLLEDNNEYEDTLKDVKTKRNEQLEAEASADA